MISIIRGEFRTFRSPTLKNGIDIRPSQGPEPYCTFKIKQH